ncbi:putative ankyrin repeat protein [Cotonvirus japonicus]|uniref:Ankyrin repeat protein n=1 Tax=Cotonvirus japonicus TaxID=2811091 RepID=A0ABM7NQU4_9VIRU|nr:putative ankyrin repeat protein [Cotonvirus japonicus]BCS82539.1 putative ankyrin repeat protein [Cotonvirus japonicus]
MYYAYVPETTKLDLTTNKLPKECDRIMKIQDLFSYKSWNSCYTRNDYILKLSLDTSNPNLKITKLSDNTWMTNYVIIHEIYPMNDLNTFVTLIQGGANLKLTKLFDWGCSYDFLDLIKFLHSYGITIENKDENCNGLWVSIICDNINILTYILDHNDYFCYNIENAIHSTCSRFNIDLFKFITKYIEINKVEINYTDKLKNDLYWSYRQGNYEFCILLEDFMINNNIYTDSHKYLYAAVEGKNLDLVKHIINKINYDQKRLNKAINIAIYNSTIEIIKYLIDLGAIISNIHNYFDKFVFYQNGRKYESIFFPIIKYMVELGACVHNNFTIENAAKTNNFVIVKYLIQQGANYENNKNLVLGRAVYYNQLDFVTYIISLGCDLNNCKKSLLKICVVRNNLKMLNYLISVGLLDNNFQALYEAIKCGKIDFIEKLISYHENINTKKILKLAAKNNHWEVIQFLFQKNILHHDYEFYDEILEIALNNKNFETFEYLVNEHQNRECDSPMYKIIMNLILDPINIYQYISNLNFQEILLVTDFIFYKNNIKMLDLLIELFDSPEYNSHILYSSIYYPDILEYLLETKHFDIYITRDIIEHSKYKYYISSTRLLLIHGNTD